MGDHLPTGYKTADAIRAAAYASDGVSWEGHSRFGLKRWDTALGTRDMASHRGRTGDLVYAFLMQHGPADVDEVIRYVQGNSRAKRRTIQKAVNHDPANRLVRLSDRRVAANPIPQDHNPDAGEILVLPDDARHRPAPVLRESELAWLALYVWSLNRLAAHMPLSVAVTGPGAAGLVQDEPMSITVVVNADLKPDLSTKLAEIADTTNQRVPSACPNVMIVTPREWKQQEANRDPGKFLNVWLRPSRTAQDGDL